MDRKELSGYIKGAYDCLEDYPWIKYPDYAVYRHKDSRKWFAVVMEIPKCKLGLKGDEKISIVNVKCDPILIGSLRMEQGIYPAYHMNKAMWVSVALDGSVDRGRICWLIEMSYVLTGKKKKTCSAEGEG